MSLLVIPELAKIGADALVFSILFENEVKRIDELERAREAGIEFVEVASEVPCKAGTKLTDTQRRYRAAMGARSLRCVELAALMGLPSNLVETQMQRYLKLGFVTKLVSVSRPGCMKPRVVWKWIGK